MIMLPRDANTETMPDAVLVASRFGIARKLTVALMMGAWLSASLDVPMEIHRAYERSTVACSLALSGNSQM